MIAFEKANELFRYDSETGLLIRRVTTGNNRFHAGTAAGCSSPDGYLRVRVDKVLYQVHRVCYLLAYGSLPDDMQVDHINHDRLDNRWINLREVNNTTNIKNCSLSSNSTTKINGVNLIKSTNKYRAYITVNKKQIHLGVFDNINDAIAARKQADIDYGFHANHGV